MEKEREKKRESVREYSHSNYITCIYLVVKTVDITLPAQPH